MNTWRKIGKDGPPESMAQIWVWWQNQKPITCRYHKASNKWMDEYGNRYDVKHTDKWTPIVPPDLPTED